MERRVYVDFNSRDEAGNVVINVEGHPGAEGHDSLSEGMLVTLFDEALQVEAKVQHGTFYKWVALPDWSTKRDI